MPGQDPSMYEISQGGRGNFTYFLEGLILLLIIL